MPEYTNQPGGHAAIGITVGAAVGARVGIPVPPLQAQNFQLVSPALHNPAAVFGEPVLYIAQSASVLQELELHKQPALEP